MERVVEGDEDQGYEALSRGKGKVGIPLGKETSHGYEGLQGAQSKSEDGNGRDNLYEIDHTFQNDKSQPKLKVPDKTELQNGDLAMYLSIKANASPLAPPPDDSSDPYDDIVSPTDGVKDSIERTRSDPYDDIVLPTVDLDDKPERPKIRPNAKRKKRYLDETKVFRKVQMEPFTHMTSPCNEKDPEKAAHERARKRRRSRAFAFFIFFTVLCFLLAIAAMMIIILHLTGTVRGKESDKDAIAALARRVANLETLRSSPTNTG